MADRGVGPGARMDNEYNYDDWAELLCAFYFDEAHEDAA